ncbi:restriction endonuclease subunit S [bacterium]|nr:restriction endonuclease subunit S [bacterium]
MSTRIDDICTYAPKSEIKAGEATKDGQYMFFTSSEDESKRYTDYQYDGEGIIMGTGGNATLHYYHGKYAVSTDCIVLKPDDRVRCKYLYYFFLANMPILEAGFKGAGLKHTNKKYIGSITIPELPPFDEQDRVIEVLDKISVIINARNLEIAALDELVKARFAEMFGDMLFNSKCWEERQLNSVADIVSGITKGRKTKTNELYAVPYMAVSNVKDGYIDWTTVKTIMATNAEIKQYRLMPGDVLMTEGGDPDKLGRGAIIHNPPKDCIHQNHIFRVRLNQNIMISTFMAQYLQHQKAKRYFLGCAKQTTGIASINMRQLSALPVLIPPIELQKEFSDFVAQVDKTKLAIQKALEQSQLLFDSLMQQYFG